jgi:hypothetical protein
MATDKSEPRTGLILQVGFLAIVTLVALHAALNSYFDHVTLAEQHRKIGAATPEALLSLRAEEKERLTSGPMPIDQAMQKMAVQGRMAASPDIVPSGSRDIAPLQGWAKMPGDVPPAMTASAAPPVPPAVASDAGAAPAHSAADGGKPAGPTKPTGPAKKKP